MWPEIGLQQGTALMAAKGTWQVKTVIASRASVQAELADMANLSGPIASLNYAASQMFQLGQEEHARSDLRRFHFTIAALKLHQRHGGLTRAQVQHAITLAQGLLLANGIKPDAPRLAFLHADLQSVLGKLHRRRGSHWLAAWEQGGALDIVAACQPALIAEHHVLLAQRLTRLGQAAAALHHLDQAAAAGLTPSQHHLEQTWRARLYRWSGHPAKAQEMVAQALRSAPEVAARTQAWQWEQACLLLTMTGDASALLTCVGKKGTHPQARHQLEASLWLRAVATRQVAGRLVLVRTFARKHGTDARSTGLLYKAALALEQCYHPDVPLSVKLAHLGTALAKASHLAHVEQELLLWAGAARFLARSRVESAAAMALGEYVGLSLRLSSGMERDVLGVAGDMISRRWFRV